MRLNRRLFLRGLGGASVAAPFLGSVVERAARAQDGLDATPPKRLIVMFTHYGCITNRWFPENSHGPLTAEDLSGTTLEVLSPHVNKLLIPRGMRAMNEWTPDLRLGQGNDPHLQVVGTYFTCMPVTPHSDNPFNFDTEVKTQAMPTGPSLDHVCAQQLSPNGMPLFVRVGGRGEAQQSAISYSAAETLFPGLGSLSDVLGTITGLFGSGSMSPDDYRVLRGQAITDLVKDDLQTLERMDMSASDRRKLDDWKSLLNSTIPTGRGPNCSEDLQVAFGLAQPFGESPIGADFLATKNDDGIDGADFYMRAAALAAACNSNPVIFLKFPGNYVFRGLGMDMESDSMSHRVGNSNMGGTCVENITDPIMVIDRFYAEKFAHLVSTLDSLEEGDQTVLDNCAAVWFQEFSDGCAMTLNNMPVIQAGSCGGYFKTGHAVNVDDQTPDLHRGNSDLCEELTDFSDPRIFGTPEEFANAPINKYYCNLMNAIGVKAGPDGRPLVGGDQEVTHYGMYDRTEDFASGGANPENITDPGGYDLLEA